MCKESDSWSHSNEKWKSSLFWMPFTKAERRGDNVAIHNISLTNEKQNGSVFRYTNQTVLVFKPFGSIFQSKYRQFLGNFYLNPQQVRWLLTKLRFLCLYCFSLALPKIVLCVVVVAKKRFFEERGIETTKQNSQNCSKWTSKTKTPTLFVLVSESQPISFVCNVKATNGRTNHSLIVLYINRNCIMFKSLIVNLFSSS